MLIWTIWTQIDGYTTLDDAWDDEATAGNPSGWEEAVDKARELAVSNKGEMQVLAVDVPDDAVFGLFEPRRTVGVARPELTADADPKDPA